MNTATAPTATMTLAQLRQEATRLSIPGRYTMRRDVLAAAVATERARWAGADAAKAAPTADVLAGRVRVPTLADMRSMIDKMAAEPAAAAPPRRAPDTKPEPAGPIWPHDAVTSADLVPGQVIQRWTEQTPSGVAVPLPCHDGQAVKLDPDRATSGVAVCRVCSESYDLELVEDFDGGYTAHLTVAYRPFLLSRAHRS